MRTYTLTTTASRPALPDGMREALNDEQLAVATAPNGPVLVLAGAGSGKTRALIYRVAYLLAQGVPPDAILLLTFTNKAAREMLSRAQAIVGGGAKGLCGGTFHSVGHRILREQATLLGYSEQFTLLDRDDAQELLNACCADVDVKARRFPNGEVLGEIYGSAVNKRMPIHQVITDDYPHFEPLTDDIMGVLQTYVTKKRALSVMDFDDLLLEWRRLFVEHPQVAQQYAQRYAHVLVDEYQDTNRLQAELCDMMSAVHRNLLVVGDDAQSIYAFRGAARENILGFPETHPGCRVFKLEQNYRSRPEILRLANASLARARSGYQKTLRATRPSGSVPALVQARDEEQQASFVAQRILELRDEGISLDEISVLYRAHYQAMALQIELGRRGIPFIVRSGVKFFESAHVKDVLCMLKSLCNPKDELAFRRVLRLITGIGQASAERLFVEISRVLLQSTDLLNDAEVARAVPKKAREPFMQFAQTLAKLWPMRQRPPAELIDVFVEGFYGDALETHYEQAALRAEDLQRLSDYAGQFPSLDAFLTEVALVSELSSEHVLKGEASDEAVVLSSVHQAKGLEWRAVFVMWLCDGKFPSQPSIGDPDSEEEERRLFYVAVTRAKDELYLTYPMLYMDRGHRQVLLSPSRFLTELQPDVHERWALEEAPVMPALG